MLFYITAFAVILIDQVTKYLIRLHLPVGESMEVWRDHLLFTHYQNSGAAFSSFQGYGRWFVPVAVLILAVVLYYRRKGQLKGMLMELGTGFFVGGAIGNAIDRVAFNQVTDFIQFHADRGILNLADLAINAGVLLMLADSLIPRRKRE